MTICLLVRHAAYDDGIERLAGRSDSALSDAGRAQAAALGRMQPRIVEAVHSSPRRRCLETITPYAEAVGQEVVVTPALDEVDFGGWTGRAFAELAGEPAWRLWNERRSLARPPGGEAMAEVQARILGYLEDVGRSTQGTVVAVTHGELIRAAILHCMSAPLDAWSAVEVPLGSATAFIIDPSGGIALAKRAAAETESTAAYRNELIEEAPP
jgi:broad specificity phosphatase PhoE